MRLILITTLIVFCAFKGHGKTTVVSDEFLVEQKKHYSWKINGVVFKPSLKKTVIYPNYPSIDTIVFFQEGSNPDTIYTRIPKNKNYRMSVGCCDASFNIYEIKKYKAFTEDIEHTLEFFDSLYMASIEVGQVKFIVHNKPDKDSLLCGYLDFSGEPSGHLMTDKKESQWIYPSKGFYTTSNDYIVFAIKHPDVEYYDEENDIVWWGNPDFEQDFDILKQFQIRVFNNEKVIIQFDYLTRNVQLEFFSQ